MYSTVLRLASGGALCLALMLSAATPALASGSHASGHASAGHAASHAGSHHSGTTHSGTHTGTTHTAHPRQHAAEPKQQSSGSHPSHPHSSSTVARDAHGRIERSEAAKHAFEVQTGYPHGRPGYVIDHIKPLACGGADAPANMQWQTVAEARAKDAYERRGCR